MILVKPSFEINVDAVEGMQMIKRIEKAGRVCYKSEDRIDEWSATKFVEMIIKRGHETVLEHEKVTARVICDRGVSHEIVRHRIASYSQESTRYVNYSKKGIGFIIPCWTELKPCEVNNVNYTEFSSNEGEVYWLMAMLDAEYRYNKLIEQGWKPEQARSVLPNSLKTEIVMTMNLRELRHFFKLRTAKVAHVQMREIAIPMLKFCQQMIPVIFDDILVED